MADKRVDYELAAQDKTGAAFDAVKARLRDTEKGVERIKGVMAQLGTVGGATMVAFFGAAMKAADDAAQATARLEGVLRATGNRSGYTSTQLGQLADHMADLTQFDDEGFRNATAAILRFGDVGGKQLERLLKLSADYAAFTGGDLVSAAETLGRAVAAPGQGIEGLKRSIGYLTEEEKRLVQQMDEAGDKMGAQAKMLDILESKIGGTAEAMNSGLTKSFKDFTKAVGELLEIFGKSSGGFVSGFLDGITAGLRGIKTVMEGDWTLKLATLLSAATTGPAGVMNWLKGVGSLKTGAPAADDAGAQLRSALAQKEAFDKAMADQDQRAIDAQMKRLAKAGEEAARERKRLRDLDQKGIEEAMQAEYDERHEIALAIANAQLAALEERKKREAEALKYLVEAEEMAAADAADAWFYYFKQIDDEQRRRAADQQAAFRSLADGLEEAFHAGFSRIGEGWKSMLSAMKDVFLRVLVEEVYKAFVKPIVVNLISSFMPGGAGLTGLLGGGLGGMLSLGVGALGIGALIHSLLDDGPENEKFRINQGAGAGPFGSVNFGGNYGGANADALSGMVGGFDSRLAGVMSEDAIAAALEKIKAYAAAGLRMDGQPAEFAFPQGDSTAGEQIALELLQSRYGIIFDGLDSGIATQIRNWSGTSTELEAFIENAIRNLESLPEAIAAANELAESQWQEMQAIIDQIQGTRGGRSVDQMAAEFQQNNAWAAGMTVTQLVEQFLTITKDDYLAYSDAQRELIRNITQLGSSAEEAATGLEATADAAFSGVYGLTPERLAQNRAIEEANRLAAAFQEARFGIRDYLDGLLMSSNLSPLSPMEQGDIANAKFWDLIGKASIGDLDALQKLPEAADLLLGLGKEIFASGSQYVDLFNKVFDAMAGLADVPTYNERMLTAGEHTAELAQASYEVNVDVRELLIQIRDQGPRIGAQTAAAVAFAVRSEPRATERL